MSWLLTTSNEGTAISVETSDAQNSSLSVTTALVENRLQRKKSINWKFLLTTGVCGVSSQQVPGFDE